MSPPTPIHIIPRDSEEGEGEIGIIENISTLQNGNTENNDVAPAGSDALSLSTATSATSIASALSNGEARPRSASFNLPAAANAIDGRPSSTPRQRSTPRSRPRSNPRTRTPMRHESPLLVTGRGPEIVLGSVASVSDAPSGNNDASTANNVNGDEANMIRSLFNTNRRHRAGSIPEEIEEAVIESAETFESIEVVNESNNQVRIEPQQQQTSTAPRAGHWLAQAATSRATRSTNPTRSRGGAHNSTQGLSDKQRPSHRKIRRWNNDRFVGTSSEQIHITLEQGDTDMTDMYWREFYMPNYPCEYKSEFAKLSTDDTKVGKNVRESFLKGEVAGKSHKKNKDGKGWMERSVMAKFQKMGISHTKNESCYDEEVMGKKLFQKLSPRIQSVLSRSCGNSNALSFASQVVTAFESYLVSLALASSKKDVESAEGYPPKQPEGTYELFEQMFASPPKIVMRNKKHHKLNSKHSHAVLVLTVHFYFKTDDDNNNSGVGSKGNGQQATSTAFYRILLYAVCQFHGLESSSTVMTPQKREKQNGRQTGASKNNGGCVKVVTVQGGVLLAPTLKLLDYVE